MIFLHQPYVCSRFVNNRQILHITNRNNVNRRSTVIKGNILFFTDIIIEAAKAANIYPTDGMEEDPTTSQTVEDGDLVRPTPICVVNPIPQERATDPVGATAAPEVMPINQEGTRASTRGTARSWQGSTTAPPTHPPAAMATTNAIDDLEGPVIHITDPRTDDTAWGTVQTEEGYYYVLHTQAPIPNAEPVNLVNN